MGFKDISEAITAVRNFMRDHAELNDLLDYTQEFTDDEIRWAIQRGIDDFNSTPPLILDVGLENFPNNLELIKFAVSHLLTSRAMELERNRLPYTDMRGISIDRKNKLNQYMSLAGTLYQSYVQWRDRYKLSKNLENCYKWPS